MPPEATILTINAVLLGYAYVWAYPSLPEKSWNAIMLRDTAISLAALGLAGALFWGSGVRFSLVVLDTNWFVFSALTLMAMEMPLFLRFAQKYDLRLDDDDDDPRD